MIRMDDGKNGSMRGEGERERDARIDDVKVTTIKEKENTRLLYMKIFTSQNQI